MFGGDVDELFPPQSEILFNELVNLLNFKFLTIHKRRKWTTFQSFLILVPIADLVCLDAAMLWSSKFFIIYFIFSNILLISKEDTVQLEILARRHDNTYLDELFVKFPDFYLDLIFKVWTPPVLCSPNVPESYISEPPPIMDAFPFSLFGLFCYYLGYGKLFLLSQLDVMWWALLIFMLMLNRVDLLILEISRIMLMLNL